MEGGIVPRTTVLFFMDAHGAVPVKRWLATLKRTDRRGFAKCAEQIQRLAIRGHELRRPHADYLRDGIHELRARRGTVQYRTLYFFHGRDAAVLVHGLKKEGKVPVGDMNRAIRRKRLFEKDPELHTYEEKHRGKDPQDP